MTSIKWINEVDGKFIDGKKSELFALLTYVISHGGIVKVISNGEKDQVLSHFKEQFALQNAE